MVKRILSSASGGFQGLFEINIFKKEIEESQKKKREYGETKYF